MTHDPFNQLPAASGPTPFPEHTRRRSSGIVPTLAVLAVGLALTSVYIASRIGGPSAGAPKTPAPRTQPASPAPTPTQAPDSASPESPATAALIESAGERLGLDHDEAVRRFEQALRAHADAWTSLNAEQNRAAIDAIVRTLLRAGGDADLAQALDRVLAPATRLTESTRLGDNEVLPAVWAWGAVAHLSALPDLPSTARDRVSARLASLTKPDAAPPATDAFAVAAADALRRVPPRLVLISDGAAGDAGSLSAWRAWLNAVSAAISTPQERDAILLDGAETALAAASRLPPDQITRSIITDILARADWSDRALARAALVRWLETPERFATRELAAFLHWLASRPTADVPPEPALRPDATPEQRRAVRDRLAAHWRLETPALLQSLAQTLRSQSKAALEAKRPDASLDALANAIHFARLTAAADRLRRIEVDRAKPILDDPRAIIIDAQNAPVSTPSAISAPPPSDGRWALRFLASRRNVSERRSAMSELSTFSDPLGPVDAEVLVEFALIGSPTDIRLVAQRAVERRADEPAILNALLESLPSAPRNDASARLYQRAVHPARLPPARDPRWVLETRRAVLARLLALAPADEGLSTLDRLARALALALVEQLPEKSTMTARLALDPDPDSAFAALWADLRTQAASLPLLASRIDEIEARLRARRTVAVGPAQHAVAQARALLESAAAFASLERSSRAPELEAILDDAHAAIDAAPSAFHQLQHANAASLQIALIRLEAPSNP